MSNYKHYNNKLNSIKRKADRDHFSNKLELNKSDMKKYWMIMSSMQVDSYTIFSNYIRIVSILLNIHRALRVLAPP